MTGQRCKHRGSQRLSTCCGDGRGVKTGIWICRLLKQSNGTTPMDCVWTLQELTEKTGDLSDAGREAWRQRVACCETCELFQGAGTTTELVRSEQTEALTEN